MPPNPQFVSCLPMLADLTALECPRRTARPSTPSCHPAAWLLIPPVKSCTPIKLILCMPAHRRSLPPALQAQAPSLVPRPHPLPPAHRLAPCLHHRCAALGPLLPITRSAPSATNPGAIYQSLRQPFMACPLQSSLPSPTLAACATCMHMPCVKQLSADASLGAGRVCVAAGCLKAVHRGEGRDGMGTEHLLLGEPDGCGRLPRLNAHFLPMYCSMYPFAAGIKGCD